jgi:hypothetical protein
MSRFRDGKPIRIQWISRRKIAPLEVGEVIPFGRQAEKIAA